MSWLSGAAALVNAILGNIPVNGTKREIVREYVQDPKLVEQLQQFRKQNAEILAKYDELVKRMEDQDIDSFEDLRRFDQKGADALVRLASQTAPLPMQGRNFGFFGITSTGKSTIINKLIGKIVAEVGAGETTMKIQLYEGQGYRLFDIPARLDVITSTVKEMTKVFRLLDAINLRYDIVVNKFDLINYEEREKIKAQIQKEIINCKLQGVNHIWLISAENPRQFQNWINMVDYLTKN